jgi:hypothetical protein
MPGLYLKKTEIEIELHGAPKVLKMVNYLVRLGNQLEVS